MLYAAKPRPNREFVRAMIGDRAESRIADATTRRNDMVRKLLSGCSRKWIDWKKEKENGG